MAYMEGLMLSSAMKDVSGTYTLVGRGTAQVGALVWPCWPDAAASAPLHLCTSAPLHLCTPPKLDAAPASCPACCGARLAAWQSKALHTDLLCRTAWSTRCLTPRCSHCSRATS